MHVKYVRTKRGHQYYRYAAVVNDDAFIIDIFNWQESDSRWVYVVRTAYPGITYRGDDFLSRRDALAAALAKCDKLTIPKINQAESMKNLARKGG